MSETVKTKKTVARARRVVAVIGNPNTGKSTLFNAMTGLKQHVGNYPGVTVERKTGTAQLDKDTTVELIDLPGTYSLAARSPDEMIAVDVLLNQLPGAPSVDAILAIADASNPERNFYLISQLLELGLPVVVAMNMLDVAASKGIEVDTHQIEKTLGVQVVGICANKGKGMAELKAALARTLDKKKSPSGKLPDFPPMMDSEVDGLLFDLNAQKEKLGRSINRLEAFRALVDKGGHAESRLAAKLGSTFHKTLNERRARASAAPLPAEEVRVRYKWVKDALTGSLKRPAQPPKTRSDTIDKWVTHWASGTLIFVALMFLVFQAIFTWATPAMDWIKDGFDTLSKFVAAHMADGALKDLVSDGIIKGVGAVLVFLPQICLLFLFIAIMEDCGYMARAAFLMDRLLSRVGLSGKSFIPMLSSFACAVPGIMATRTIENWRDRLTTILVAPLMSCSARLPVYTLMITAFIPKRGVAGISWLGLQGLTMFCMYFVGLVAAVPVAWILKKTLLKGETPPFLIELPSYKTPDWRGVLLRVLDRAKAFIVRAGTIILAVAIVVWALTYFPHSREIAERYEARRAALLQSQEAEENRIRESVPQAFSSAFDEALKIAAGYDKVRDKALEEAGGGGEDEKPNEKAKLALEEHAHSMDLLSKTNIVFLVWPEVLAMRKINESFTARVEELGKQEKGDYLRASYFGRMGKTVEPLFKPLGWDWRISMAAMASFPAREVIVATLGTIFNQGDDAKVESKDMREALTTATWDDEPERKLFNIPVALSIMVFFALCSQCAATLATIKRETNSWWWPVFSFTYMTALAYIAAMVTYQVGMRI